jgi:ring-1,2-phenylacetyl-CoA epoxidase subunit PaaE
MFHEALEDIKNRYLTRFVLYNVFSREEQDIDLFNGRSTGAGRAFLETLMPADDDRRGLRVRTRRDDRRGRGRRCSLAGVPSEHVHLERFGVPDSGAAPVEPGDAPQAQITIMIDGTAARHGLPRPASVDPRRRAARRNRPALLVQGRHVLHLPRPSCSRAGAMDKNFTLEPPISMRAIVLTCQAHPLTERVVISYDDECVINRSIQ